MLSYGQSLSTEFGYFRDGLIVLITKEISKEFYHYHCGHIIKKPPKGIL